MALPTLLNTRSPLASTATERAVLEALPLSRTFDEALAAAGHAPLRPVAPTVLQMNVGKRCNQACHHCHVDAGPDRTEVMTDAVVDGVLDVLRASGIPTLDITGGAPELHPRFREIVQRARALDRHVIDRCNLTITTLPNYEDLPGFLAAHQVEVIASLPSYAGSQTDRQRGDGVFERSMTALRRFNALGYGRDGSGLVLNLVTNPVGAFLPAGQASLEADWKRELKRRHGIEFNRLFTITNMPISRYLEWLERSGNLESYMTRLVNAFNPASTAGLMCRYTVSVGWDGPCTIAISIRCWIWASVRDSRKPSSNLARQWHRGPLSPGHTASAARQAPAVPVVERLHGFDGDCGKKAIRGWLCSAQSNR